MKLSGHIVTSRRATANPQINEAISSTKLMSEKAPLRLIVFCVTIFIAAFESLGLILYLSCFSVCLAPRRFCNEDGHYETPILSNFTNFNHEVGKF